MASSQMGDKRRIHLIFHQPKLVQAKLQSLSLSLKEKNKCIQRIHEESALSIFHKTEFDCRAVLDSTPGLDA